MRKNDNWARFAPLCQSGPHNLSIGPTDDQDMPIPATREQIALPDVDDPQTV